MEKVAAVVVTYNRKNLLIKCVKALENQSRPLDAIYVINNNSSDGTKEWLDTQKQLNVIHQDNVGGAGGFYRGIKEAYNAGYDLIWAMDDDVNPTQNCLKTLMECRNTQTGILCPQRRMNGKIILGETLKFNLSNPLKPFKRNLLLSDFKDKKSIGIEGMAFEGPLIEKAVIKNIGFPNKDLFIFYDDSDYSYRATTAGFKVNYITDATLNKEDLSQTTASHNTIRSWKVVYGLRNQIYFCTRYGKNFIYRFLYPKFILLQYILGFLRHQLKCDGYYQKADLKMFYQAYKQGICHKLVKF